MPITLDVSDDFESIVDNLEPITLGYRNGSTVDVTLALRRAIDNEDAAGDSAAGTFGKVLTADVIWHLPKNQVATRPDHGGTITDAAGTIWEILAVQEQTFGERWRCHTRELSITATLDTIVHIQRATTTKDRHGSATQEWQHWKMNVRARIQPVDVTNQEMNEARIGLSSHVVFLGEDVSLGPLNRIVDKDNRIYQIIRTEGREQIGELQRVFVQQTPFVFA